MVKEKFTIEQLGQEVVKEIVARIPQAEVKVIDVRKNNNLILHGINIRDSQESNGIIPTIYLDNYYDEYCNDKLTAEEIAERVIEIYNEEKGKVSLDIRELTEFDKAKKNLRIKLICTERNKEFLEKVPHKAFLDMSIVYQVKALIEDDSVGTTVVTNELFKMYGVSVDELHESALASMKESEPVEIEGLSSKLMWLATKMDYDLEMDLGELASQLEDEQMIMISNQKNIFGASQILYKENLQKMASILKQDFYILPSSVHELLAVRAEEGGSVEELKAMVRETNRTQVLPDEILSDNVYYYSIATGELSIA